MFRSYSGLLSPKQRKRKSRASTIHVLSAADSETNSISEPVEIWAHSRVVEDEEKNQNGCFTTLPVRVHKQDAVAEGGTQRFSQDLAGIVEDETVNKAGCFSSPVGNYASFLYPECLPERLKIVTYLTELGYLKEEQTETKPCEEGAENTKEPAESPRKKLLNKAMTELAEMNQLVGLEIIDGYKNAWDSTKEIPTSDTVANLDDLVALRRSYAGIDVYYTLMGFSHGTRFSKEDHSTMKDLLDSAERAMFFTNDYYSWAAEKHDRPRRVANVISFLMLHENISEDDAKAKTKELILDSEKEFVKRREALYTAHPDLAPQLRKWAEVLGAAIGGVHYWCANAPRYVFKEEEPVVESEVVEEPTETVEATVVPNGVEEPETAVPDEVAAPTEENDAAAAQEPEDIPEQPKELPIVTPVADAEAKATAPVTLDTSALLAPTSYIRSVSANDLQSDLIAALNLWLQVPSRPLGFIKQVVDDLHDSTQILSDLQDHSSLRKGKTAAQGVFGPAQSMNSAAYMYVRIAKLVNSLNCPGMLDGLFEELEAQFVGQSWELHWRHELSVPSEQEYLAMIDKKTGSTFKLLTRLMQSTAMKGSTLEFDAFTDLLGRWYHLREDYRNLQGNLDQGKLTYPIIKCCHADPIAKKIILGIFRQKHEGVLASESKMQILELLLKSGAMQQTYALIQQLTKEIEKTLTELEVVAEEINPKLRLVVRSLGNVPAPVKL